VNLSKDFLEVAETLSVTAAGLPARGVTGATGARKSASSKRYEKIRV